MDKLPSWHDHTQKIRCIDCNDLFLHDPSFKNREGIYCGPCWIMYEKLNRKEW